MTTNQRMRVRTPRKEKVWIGTNTSDVISSSGTRGVAGDLLSTGLTSAGLNTMASPTFMRFVGVIRLKALAAASSAGVVQINWGIAWVPQDILNAGDGDAQIPEPNVNNLRQIPWIQQGELEGTERVTGDFIDSLYLDPIELSSKELDIRQMRKQPTYDHRLALIWRSEGAAEANTVTINLQGQVLLALP